MTIFLLGFASGIVATIATASTFLYFTTILLKRIDPRLFQDT